VENFNGHNYFFREAEYFQPFKVLAVTVTVTVTVLKI
jgi:hypothetical protein